MTMPVTGPTTGTRDEWLAARLALLEEEKEHTRRSDELARRRQALPWVRVEKAYAFDTEAGRASLGDLFAGRSQLLVYHFMFGPGYEAGCPSCSAIADGFDRSAVHLANHDVTLMAVSRAPLAKLLAFRARMGWQFPWASSAPGDFNADYGVGFTAAQQRDGAIEYNWRRERPMPAELGAQRNPDWRLRGSALPVVQMASMAGTDVATYTRERPGMSAFVRHEGEIYHTYSTYSRGVDALWGMYPWLDRAPLGRNEQGVWWRHRDAYEG